MKFRKLGYRQLENTRASDERQTSGRPRKTQKTQQTKTIARSKLANHNKPPPYIMLYKTSLLYRLKTSSSNRNVASNSKVTHRETKEKIVNLSNNSHDEQKSISSETCSYQYIRMARFFVVCIKPNMGNTSIVNKI